MRAVGIGLMALLSHWRRHPLQCFGVFAGLWLATALWTGVQALNAQARADYDRASAVLSAPAAAQLVARAGGRLEQADYILLRRAGWPVSPMLEGRIQVGGPEGIRLRVLGIDPLTLPAGATVAGEAFGAFDLDAFMGSPGQAWIAPDTLRRLESLQNERPFTADGRALPPMLERGQLAPGVIVLDIGHAQKLLEADGQLSRMLLPADFAAAARPLPEGFLERLEMRESAADDDLQRLTDSFHLNLTALALLSFIVGLFIVHAAMGLAFEQRLGLLRTVRACGLSLRALIGALTIELGSFAIVGGLAGVASGYALAGLLLPDVAASLRGLYGAEVAGRLNLPWQWWLAGVGMSMMGALVAGGGGLLRAARMPLLALARPQAWRMAQGRWLKRQAVLAGVLGVVAVASWWSGSSLAAAFLMLGALLLAGALMLPPLLNVALAMLARIVRRPLAQWFVADSRQQLPALSLALMALLLALAASVGVGSMTEGFRKTFIGWLDQRLASDLYLTPDDTAQALEISAWLERRADVAAVLPQWRADVRLQGWPVHLQGIVDDVRYRGQWPLLEQEPGAWAELAAGRGVMLSEQLARRLHARLGDVLPMPGNARPDASMKIVGVYADYGNPRGHLLVHADWLRHHAANAALANLRVQMNGGKPGTLEEELESHWNLDDGQVVDQASLKRWSTQVFERTFAATAALNSLTLGVAGMALFISLLTLGDSRLGQLAPLWALGVRRGRLAWLSLAQMLMLAGLTVLLAMPLGLLLAWCLVAVVNVQAFGWRLPLHVFPGQLLQLGLLGLATSLVAAAWPLWQLARREPSDLLRQFANER